MSRDDTPIKAEEVLAALLSESPETIRIVMQGIGAGMKVEAVIEGARELLRSVEDDGAEIPLAEEKLKAIEG